MDENALREPWNREVRKWGVSDDLARDLLFERVIEKEGGREFILEIYADYEPELALKDLLASTREELDRLSGNGEPEGIEPQQPDEYERRRAEAYSVYAAKIAATEFRVLRFRDRALDGRTLTVEEAKALLTSPVAAQFSTAWFRRHRVPVVAHVFEVNDVEDGQNPHEARRVIEVNGRHFDQQAIRWILNGGPVFPGEILHPEDDTILSAVHTPIVSVPLETLGIGEGDVLALERSVVGELVELGQKLASWYSWEEEEALRFIVLGDIVPQIAPLKAQVALRRRGTTAGAGLNHGHITLTAEPWVSPETVRDFYQTIRQQVFGRKTRQFSERNVTVFKFVTERMEVETVQEPGQLPSSRLVRRAPWRALMEAWNSEHRREWSYKDPRNFEKDFHRGRRAVARPKYSLP
ncbi:MAG TPA: hypothetical protein VFH16_16860 [Rubrobacter sp.]|nr:hypothetical protein [Rubrobacter sp.]